MNKCFLSCLNLENQHFVLIAVLSFHSMFAGKLSQSYINSVTVKILRDWTVELLPVSLKITKSFLANWRWALMFSTLWFITVLPLCLWAGGVMNWQMRRKKPAQSLSILVILWCFCLCGWFYVLLFETFLEEWLVPDSLFETYLFECHVCSIFVWIYWNAVCCFDC